MERRGKAHFAQTQNILPGQAGRSIAGSMVFL